jgi:type IV pilus assembly protein PilP
MLAVLVSTLWLSGCGQDDSTELRDWMESVKKETRLVVPKLNPPKTYMPVPYEVKADIDPFNPEN